MSTSKNKKTAFAGSSTRGPVGGSKISRKGAPASIDSQSRIGRKSVYGGASRTLLSSASRKNAQLGAIDKLAGPAKPPVQVFDEEGHDVTPVSLLQADPNAVRQKQSNLLADSSVGTPTDLMSQASIYQTGTINASTFGGGPFTRSVFSASQSGRSTGSLTDDIGDADMTSNWTDTKVQYKREEVKEILTEDDLEKSISIKLTETPTIWLLDMCGVCVSLETEEAAEVQKQNSRYQELIKSRVGNDRYMERGMNTFNQPPKFKNVQTTKIQYSDAGVNASKWDMHDTYKLVEDIETKAKLDAEEDETISRPVSIVDKASDKEGESKDQITSESLIQMSKTQGTDEDGTEAALSQAEDRPKGSIIQQTVNGSLFVSLLDSGESFGAMSSMLGNDSALASKESGVAAGPDQAEADGSQILESENLRHDLVIMERVVNLNTYQAKQASFRGYQIFPDVDAEIKEEAEPVKPSAATQLIEDLDRGPSLDRLWAYTCPLTKGRNISCIAWNKKNPDLLAVGYGQFEYTKQKSGLVCCWSLKNPEYPERVYHTATGVTALDFSQAHPNLLAAGLYDGTVAIYNVKTTNNEPVLDSFKDMRSVAYDDNGEQCEAAGKHTGPVWQLRWIEKERGSGEERAEVLVSVSTDGRVTQWSIRKGFESYDLMKLKRVSSKTQGGKVKKAEAFISRFAGGLCFDFSTKDSNIYLAGTEEGQIHRCSCSYNEQYLDSYFGHAGPVYSLQWSPFCPDMFLSCSGDWTVKLWHQDRLQPVLTFHSSTKSVPSVCWSPRCSTVFACVNEGAVEIWDLQQSTLDPIVFTNTPNTKLSYVTFTTNSECLLVGDSEGGVAVLQLKGMPEPPQKQAEALYKVMQSSIASQLQQKK